MTKDHKQPKHSSKKDIAGGITLLDFKLYYKAIVTNTVWYWQKKRQRHIDQWNRLKRPEINSCLYSQLIFDKGANKMQQGNGIEKTGQLHAKE